MKRSPQFVGLLCVLAALMPQALAQEAHSGTPQGMSGTLSATPNVRIKVDMGSVVVHGGSQQGIRYVVHSRYYPSEGEGEARHQSGAIKINSYVKGDTTWIVAEWDRRRSVKFSGEFVIDVPRDTATLKVETGGGGVEATGIAGSVGLTSGGGKIRVDDIGGSVNVETGGDSIDVGTVGGDLKLETGGGNITIGSVKGRVQAETGGGNVTVVSSGLSAVIEAGAGNVEIKRCGGKVKASTGGGSVTLGDIAGPAEIDTAGGSIRLTSAKGRVGASAGAGSIELYGVPSARVETGTGGITVKFINTGAERSDSMLETSAGDITVYIAADVAIDVRASVDLGNGHHITSDFSDIRIASEGDKWGPRTLQAEGKLNGGGPLLKVRTTTGNICIRRAKQ